MRGHIPHKAGRFQHLYCQRPLRRDRRLQHRRIECVKQPVGPGGKAAKLLHCLRPKDRFDIGGTRVRVGHQVQLGAVRPIMPGQYGQWHQSQMVFQPLANVGKQRLEHPAHGQNRWSRIDWSGHRRHAAHLAPPALRRPRAPSRHSPHGPAEGPHIARRCLRRPPQSGFCHFSRVHP